MVLLKLKKDTEIFTEKILKTDDGCFPNAWIILGSRAKISSRLGLSAYSNHSLKFTLAVKISFHHI